MLSAIILIIVGLSNIISASMFIDMYNKHDNCITDKKWKDMKGYMIFILIAGIVGVLVGGGMLFLGGRKNRE